MESFERVTIKKGIPTFQFYKNEKSIHFKRQNRTL